jgi:hypothetical protein
MLCSLSLLSSVALAQSTLVVPVGRVAVIAPQQAPTELAIDRPDVLSVQPVMPWLIATGKTAGSATLRVLHEGGEHRWSVTVDPDATAPSGGSVLDQPTVAVSLAVDDGVLLPWPADATALSVVAPGRVTAQRFGERWLWLQGDGAGVSDVVVERGEEVPQIYTVTVGRAGPAPEGAVEPGDPIELTTGGRVALPGKVPAGWIVGRRERVILQADTSLWLTGGRPGRSWVVLGYEDGSVSVRPVTVVP